jgi:hypothetical protein
MRTKTTDTKAEAVFPPPPVAASKLLVPITSWPEMFREEIITGVEFDAFWYECVEDRVAYFFSWLGEPRSTVLVVWDDEGPTHVECRRIGDLVLSTAESMPIIAELGRAFRNAGLASAKAKPHRTLTKRR